MPGIDIQVLAVVDNQGRMVSISALAAASVSGISGELVWPDHKFANTVLFVYSDPAWNNRVAQAEVAEDGEYKIGLPPGKYYLLAVVDENNTNLLDVGDKFGIWGVTKLGMFPKAVEGSI